MVVVVVPASALDGESVGVPDARVVYCFLSLGLLSWNCLISLSGLASPRCMDGSRKDIGARCRPTMSVQDSPPTFGESPPRRILGRHSPEYPHDPHFEDTHHGATARIVLISPTGLGRARAESAATSPSPPCTPAR